MRWIAAFAALALAGAVAWALARGGPAREAGWDAMVLDGVAAADGVDGVDTAVAEPDAAAAGAEASPLASEEELMGRLRASVDAQPEEALAAAAAADRAFPAGRFADERAFLVMRALVHLDRIGEARAAAAAFHDRFPGSKWAEQVVRLTGYHPRRYGPKP